MTATEKLAQERDGLKNARQERILLAAFTLFAQNGMDAIAMTDIAREAEIGVASLYRYFATKDEIAIRTAIWAWESQKKIIMPLLETDDYESLDGISQLRQIITLFGKLYETEPDFFRFIYFFDAYVVCQKITPERLEPYQNVILGVQETISDAIRKGIEDGSISKKYKDRENGLYFSLMHTIFATSQKLSLSGQMLMMDKDNDGSEQLKLLGDILIEGLK